MTAMTLTRSERIARMATTYQLETVPTLERIASEELQPLTAGRTFYVSRPWLMAVERQRGDRTAYILCRDYDGTLLGVCPVYWGKPSSRGYYDPFGHFFRRSGATFNRGDWNPAYIVGSRAAYCCEFLVDATVPAGQQQSVLKLLLDAAAAHADGVEAASLSALYLNAAGTAQLDGLLTHDCAYYLAGANSGLDVVWSSLDEYVEAMGRKAANIRREMRVFARQGYLLIEGPLSEWIDTAAELFSQLERRYGHSASVEAEAAELRILAACADDHSHVLAIRDGPDVIGAVLLFLWEDVVYVRSAGFNYAATKRAFEYFNLVYYETIRYAIEHGHHRLDFGMATYRAKLARGARLEPLWGVSVSRTAESPFGNEHFARWDQQRRDAVHSADPLLLERAQLP
jgi:predicted N-acyltransferase